MWGPELPYQNAFFMFHETEVNHGEYDVPQCKPGTPPDECVHTLELDFQLQSAMKECKGPSDVGCATLNMPNASYPQSQHVALVSIIKLNNSTTEHVLL